MRHAFLIIAHDNFILLQKLILTLECQEVDFYVHVDAKSGALPELYVSGESTLHVLQDRIDTRWGDYSQITTELLLLEKAYSKGRYSHYHIISGTHFPVRPVREIISFYADKEGETVLCGLCRSTALQETMKLRHYNLFTRRLAYGSSGSRRMFQRLWNLSHSIQSAVRIRRNKNTVFYKASNWASFSEEAVEFLLSERTRIRKLFRWTFCGDEYFSPTMLKMSSLRDKVVSCDSLLKQEMGDANPRVFSMDDFDSLISSDCLFARKFSDAHIDVVNRIAEYIKR